MHYIKLDYILVLIGLCVSYVLSNGNHLATFTLKVLEFQNNELRHMDGTCCGEKGAIHSSVCTSHCSLEFRACLEPFALHLPTNYSLSYTGPCVYGEVWTKHWGNSDTTYTVKEAPEHGINITLPWPRFFTIILEAYDLVTMKDRRIIDRTSHRTVLRPAVTEMSSTNAGTRLAWHHVTSTTQRSGYTFSMRLRCQPHHYNDTCTKICWKNNPHYTCDSNGDKVCEAGWSGPDCDKAICKVGCHTVHGSCSRPDECDCAIGWEGPYCDLCTKYPGCKHGTCDNAPFTCHCLPNWGGPFCDQDLDYCGRHNPCKNGGICRNVNDTNKQFECRCHRGFSGKLCEEKLPPCKWNPCQRGRCVPRSENDYMCKCEPGWRGEHCDENIDFCQQNVCLNGGTCQDLDGVGFRCLCPPGFKGANCQLRSPCANSKCVHARDCSPLIPPRNGSHYECICQPGWTGQFCDQNIDDCVDKCRNGGNCHDLLDDYFCTCKKGFYGRNCEINRECASNPCQNDGICHEITGGYRCECPKGFTGHNCEVLLTSCNPNPCHNGAYCYTLPTGFYCKCSDEFYGQFCEHARPYCGAEGCAIYLDPCYTGSSADAFKNQHADNISNLWLKRTFSTDEEERRVSLYSSVCGRHGTCVSSVGEDGTGYQCICKRGFKGKYCNEAVNYCENDPCFNGATCVNSVTGYECLCTEGFVGTHCQTPLDLCQPNPCHNNGYCQNTLHPGDFQCRCAPGWSGRWCQMQTVDPCANAKLCFNGGVCHSDQLHPGGFRCACSANWTGSVCQLRLPASRACGNRNLCKNDATCVDVGDNFNCICRPGFDGRHCENNVNECNSMPCFNNGTCEDLINTFECTCPKGFAGHDCRLHINECATHPCAFGSDCVDGIGDYKCICPEGRHDRNCEEVHIFHPPNPPACNFHNRIYDHNQTWVYNCQKCQCSMGQIICEDDFCGYWSCYQASGKSDRFACKSDQTCHVLSPVIEEDCFVRPCYPRSFCLSKSQSIESQVQILLPKHYPAGASPGCQPNAARLNNRCARIRLEFSKHRLPYGVTVRDICTAVRQLPSILFLREQPQKAQGFGISCGKKAVYEEVEEDTIEITLSSMDDQIQSLIDGKEYTFIHLLAINLTREVVDKASTNLSLDDPYFKDDRPLPPFVQLLGTSKLPLYWHRVLLGVVEVDVDTIIVKEKDSGSPYLTLLLCSLIILTAIISIIFICLYAQRKTRYLLLKYAPTSSQMNNNDSPSGACVLLSNSDGHEANKNDSNATEIPDHQNYRIVQQRAVIDRPTFNQEENRVLKGDNITSVVVV